jgi:hypothetical protein
MSEVKRYGHIGYLVNATERIRDLYRDMKVYVLESDYDAAQSKLAALREELAKKDGRGFTQVVKDNAALQQSLADAERRNSELVAEVARRDALLEELGCPFDPVSDLFSMPENPKRESMVDSVREAWRRAHKCRKPTESGASE